MSTEETAKPRVAETFIAAYYLAHFFSALQTALFYTERRWWRSLILQAEIMNLILIVICLTIGVGLIYQKKWAKIAAFAFSLCTILARWSNFPLRSTNDWATIVISTLFNAAIVVYFVWSWSRAREQAGTN